MCVTFFLVAAMQRIAHWRKHYVTFGQAIQTLLAGQHVDFEIPHTFLSFGANVLWLRAFVFYAAPLVINKIFFIATGVSIRTTRIVQPLGAGRIMHNAPIGLHASL
jgi:hypothetical protein